MKFEFLCFVYYGTAAGAILGMLVMMIAMAIDSSNVNWAGPLSLGLTLLGMCVGGAVASAIKK